MSPLVEQDCVHLVCEFMGVNLEEEVNVEKVCLLYQKVFHTSANLDDTQRAISQICAQNAGLPCSGKMLLHVLLLMERERESRDRLYWELQMLKSGRICSSGEKKSQPQLHSSGCKQYRMQDLKHWSMRSLLEKARKLSMKLNLDGVWNVLPSLSHGQIAAPFLGWINPTISDILLLLQYKYDIIREQLYREMLQDEFGVVWWESLTSQEQVDCVWNLGDAAEQAFKQMDLIRLCELPGALRCYRSGGPVFLQACGEGFKPRDEAWSSKPKEQAWSAAVFLSELESHYQQERDSLTVLINRADRVVLRDIYLSVCVAVRRAERETHSHTALLASRQFWDKWPYVRGSMNQELLKFWLQEKPDPTKRFTQDWRVAGCTQQQAVLQCLVLCQEQERRSLLEILHTLSLNELQESSHTLPHNASNAASLRQSCMMNLRKMKASLHEVSWSDCAIQLLTQLTLAHDEEAWTLLYSLPFTESSGVKPMLHKYVNELHSPKLHNLYELLQTPASRVMQTNTVALTDGERTEQRQRDPSPSESEAPALCSGCGVVLVPEDAPYLEILGPKQQKDEESTEGEGREKERRDGADRRTEANENETRENAREWTEIRIEERREGAEERRGLRIDEEREEAGEHNELRMVEERKEAEESTEVDKEEVSEGAETREADMFLEKQGSLITLAWSIPTDSMTKDQEMSASLAEKDAAEISRNSTTQISTQQVHAECLISHNEEQSHINPEDRDFAQLQSQEQKHSEHPGHSLTTEEHAFFQTPQDPASSADAECEGSGVDGHNTHCTPQTHTPEKAETEAFSETQEREIEDACEQICEEVCVDVCEEQQLQREATMRSLVHIQRRAERRWQRDRDRQLLRVQERLAIVQNRKSDEDLLGLTQDDAFRHLTTSLQQEDEEHQKILVREKLQQLRRERSYILQSRRERNTAGFKELLAPTAQHMTNTEDGL